MTAGVILAAGVSSRMGRFKPMLPIGNTSFIKRLICQMRDVGVKDIVVVTGYLRDELTEHLKDQDVICVHNDSFYASQMLDSVKLGIRKVTELPENYDGILLSPSDVVMSPKWIFEAVMDSVADFVRPVYHGEPGHPVLINQSLFEYILNYNGERGLRGAVESSGMKIVELNAEEPNILLDADTREDYRKAVSEYDRAMGDKGRLHMDTEIKLVTDKVVCGEGFLQLLELVDKSGSLVNAAEALKISYTKIWKILKYVEGVTDVRLIERTVGGEEGGSSILTKEGKDLLRRYKAMRIEFDAAAQKIFDRYFEDFRI